MAAIDEVVDGVDLFVGLSALSHTHFLSRALSLSHTLSLAPSPALLSFSPSLHLLSPSLHSLSLLSCAAPSEHILQRMSHELPAIAGKSLVLDYGFELQRLPLRPSGFRASPKVKEGLVFGFTGRHHPSKGVDLLLRAFYSLPSGDSVLRIWGRLEGQVSVALKTLARQLEAQANEEGSLGSKRVEWRCEYENSQLYEEVFMKCDVLVVPSVWDENSPLVIHEAQQCRVPVITAAHGGMGEFVVDGINGLTFTHRDAVNLAQVLQRAIADQETLAELGRRGYLKSLTGDVLTSTEEARTLSQQYYDLVSLHCAGSRGTQTRALNV